MGKTIELKSNLWDLYFYSEPLYLFNQIADENNPNISHKNLKRQSLKIINELKRVYEYFQENIEEFNFRHLVLIARELKKGLANRVIHRDIDEFIFYLKDISEQNLLELKIEEIQLFAEYWFDEGIQSILDEISQFLYDSCSNKIDFDKVQTKLIAEGWKEERESKPDSFDELTSFQEEPNNKEKTASTPQGENQETERIVFNGSSKQLAFIIRSMVDNELIEFELEEGNVNESKLARLVEKHFCYKLKGKQKEINIPSFAQSLNPNNEYGRYWNGNDLFKFPNIISLDKYK